MKEVLLENAHRLSQENPDTFSRDISNVAVGTFVKVCHMNIPQPERFWVAVTAFDGKEITGTVSNHLQFSWLKHGDLLVFELDNVYQVFIGEAGTDGEADNMRGVHKECNV